MHFKNKKYEYYMSYEEGLDESILNPETIDMLENFIDKKINDKTAKLDVSEKSFYMLEIEDEDEEITTRFIEAATIKEAFEKWAKYRKYDDFLSDYRLSCLFNNEMIMKELAKDVRKIEFKEEYGDQCVEDLSCTMTKVSAEILQENMEPYLVDIVKQVLKEKTRMEIEDRFNKIDEEYR